MDQGKVAHYRNQNVRFGLDIFISVLFVQHIIYEQYKVKG